MTVGDKQLVKTCCLVRQTKCHTPQQLVRTLEYFANL